jgi:hypothetical protein
MEEKYEQILKMFCAGSDMPEWMREPFTVVHRAASTNGTALVSVPEWIGGEYKDYTDKTRTIYPFTYEMNVVLPIEEIKNAISKIPLVDGFDEKEVTGKCTECYGSGEVDFEYDANNKTYYLEGECPICEGQGTTVQTIKTPNGKKVPDASQLVKLGSQNFNIEKIGHLLQVAEILNEKDVIVLKQSKNTTCFKIGEVEMVIASFIKGDEKVYAEITINPTTNN